MWNEKIDYLKTSRQYLWNDDYFEFLVEKVWKIEKPVNIIDFGCGYGYLGMKMLPVLADGSTYTGIDIAEKLLEEAEAIFSETQYKTHFIKSDLLEFDTKEKYDVVICQAVLRHIPEAKEVMKKMVEVAVNGGLIICIEPNRRMENAGLYIDDREYDATSKDIYLQEHWNHELKNGGRDYLIGSKISVYMEELGLKHIGIRVNDFVEYVSRDKDGTDFGRPLDFRLRG